MSRLLERRGDLADFDSFQFGGTWIEDNRAFTEAIYLWHRPLRLMDGKLRRVPGEVATTPLNEAIRTTLQGWDAFERPSNLIW
jgi:hypothetical protein